MPTDSFGHPLAEWWKRLVAIVIDNVVLGIPAFIVFIVLVAGAASQTETDPVTGEITKGGGGLVAAAVLGYAIMLILPFIYFTIMNGSRRGQTFGKMLLKIQVRDAATGGPLGMGKAFLRYLIATILGVFTCGLGGILNGLWPLWDDKRQALHDKVATSVVVDTG